MLRKIASKNIALLLIIVLAGCAAEVTPQVSGQTQNATNDPKIYLPLVTTPTSCTTATTMNGVTADTVTPEATPAPPLEATVSPEDSAALTGTSHYVTTSGTSSGDGTMAHPWDLDDALLKSNWVSPGDTIWVRGGTYHPTVEPAKFNIKVGGVSGNPVYIRAYPGERVTIDARIEIYTPYVVFWGFEVMSSSTDRTSNQTGSHPSDMTRSGGVGVYAANVTLINNVIHDGRDGITADADAPNAVIYGNLSYNNGWSAPDRGHGHGVYTQNETGTKDIEENIVFNNFGGYSFHTYTEQSYLNNYTFHGNVVMNNDFLVGGLNPAKNISITENYVYNTTLQLGYDAKNNSNLTLENNWLWGQGETSLEVYWWSGVSVSNNCIFNSTSTDVSLRYPSSPGSYTWNANLYGSSASRPFSLNDSSKSWAQWLSSTSYDQSSKFQNGYPSSPQVIVRPNQYDAKRGNIIVFNWTQASNITVDISKLGLQNGDHYTLHNVQNYYAETISGTYNGSSINIPMTGWSVAVPIGWSEPLKPSTFPNFGVFVLTSP